MTDQAKILIVDDSADIVEVLADFLALILKHEGTLERFTGDGMMVFFNDPVLVSNPEERAVRMAVATASGELQGMIAEYERAQTPSAPAGGKNTAPKAA